jgi:signal transduction histidine kinase/ligand-binding sensor domain-containing protein
LLLGLAWLFATIDAPAQYRFDSFTTDNGLPQNSSRQIAQTPDGYLWVATFDGLARFDGAKFTVFDKSNSPGIASNPFTCLHVEPDGTLLAGTEDGGLTLYRDGKFRTLTVADGLPSNTINFGFDRHGRFLVSTPQGDRYFREDKFIPVPASETVDRTGLFSPPSGNFWQISHEGVRQTARDGRETFYPLKTKFLNDYFGGIRLFEDRAGELWFGDEAGVYRLSNGTINRFTEADGVPRGAILRPFLEEADGGIWFGSGSSLKWHGVGAVRFKDGKFTTWGTEAGLSSNLILEIFQDREGTVWMGTADRGLDRLRKQLIRSLSTGDGLLQNEVYPILQTRDSSIYVGTTEGLSRYADGTFIDVVKKDEKGKGVPVSALYEDDAGNIWIGALNELYRLNHGRLEHVIDGWAASPWVIQGDGEGNVWVGTDHGLCQFRDGKLVAQFATPEGLPDTDIKAIHEDRNGILWLGTYGGLVRLDTEPRRGDEEWRSGGERRRGEGVKGSGGEKAATPGSDRITPSPLHPFTPSSPLPIATTEVPLSAPPPRPFSDLSPTRFTVKEGLASDRVRTIYEDDSGALWIGTYDGGMSRYADGKFFNFNINNGLFSNGVFQIIEDGRGFFWISSNRGIFRVNRRELEDVAAGRASTVNSVAYGKQDGMLNSECNGGRQPAGIKTADGKLWFPTMDGVAVLDPGQVTINPLPPPVLIEKALIQRQEIDIKQGITLYADRDNLEIRFTGISSIKPEQIKFRYRIEGLQENWTDLGPIREVYFPSLPAGTYTFHVIAANADGVWNETGARIKITVLPPFWRTWWFISLVIMGVVGLAFAGYKVRTTQLKNENRRQEAFSRRLIELQENERKRIAGELHDSLSQNLVIIKNRAMISLQERKDTDQAFEQLEEIAEAAGESLSEVREIAHNLRPFQIDRLGLTKAIEALVRKANTPELKVTAALDDIDSVLLPEMEINLYRILQESLNNIIKHAGASEASVTITRIDRAIEVMVQDNGQGFDASSTRLGESKDGTGFGLVGITERARILGCTPVIESSPGHGTKISITVTIERSILPVTNRAEKEV